MTEKPSPTKKFSAQERRASKLKIVEKRRERRLNFSVRKVWKVVVEALKSQKRPKNPNFVISRLRGTETGNSEREFGGKNVLPRALKKVDNRRRRKRACIDKREATIHSVVSIIVSIGLSPKQRLPSTTRCKPKPEFRLVKVA